MAKDSGRAIYVILETEYPSEDIQALLVALGDLNDSSVLKGNGLALLLPSQKGTRIVVLNLGKQETNA